MKSIVSGDWLDDGAEGSPTARASSVAAEEAARVCLEAYRLKTTRPCVSQVERRHQGVDAAGAATRVASGWMANRVGRTTTTGLGRWTVRASPERATAAPACIDRIAGTRAQHKPTITPLNRAVPQCPPIAELARSDKFQSRSRFLLAKSFDYFRARELTAERKTIAICFDK
jgi:hypothetical protein|tara:strand:+ start:4362 stop:4877 length:516 start_codon:yes stop_codon:yes gene_type:complete